MSYVLRRESLNHYAVFENDGRLWFTDKVSQATSFPTIRAACDTIEWHVLRFAGERGRFGDGYDRLWPVRVIPAPPVIQPEPTVEEIV